MADTQTARKPSPKCPKTSVMNTFLEILEEVGATVSGSDVDRYLSEPLSPFIKQMLTIGGDKTESVSTTIKISSALRDCYAQLVTSMMKENRLAPEKAEMLLFIKTNFKLV